MKLLIINGPNLNLLGAREPQIYGHRSFSDYLLELRAAFPVVELRYEQTNHEGRIIDLIQQAKAQGISGIVLNPGGYSHSSVAIADAILAVDTPVVSDSTALVSSPSLVTRMSVMATLESLTPVTNSAGAPSCSAP